MPLPLSTVKTPFVRAHFSGLLNAVFIVCWLFFGTALVRAEAARQWQVSEFSFSAETEVADPFDFERVRFSATFVGPEKVRLEVPGFWDGGRTWKIRFTPTRAGEWSFVTSFSNEADGGLHQRGGRFKADAADTADRAHAVRRHGGFLKVGENQRHLTHTDGTPFFWLGDTWWAAPSAAMPFENFRRAVDARVAQGYTVFQAHGHRPLFPDAKGAGMGALEGTSQPDAETLRYWREVDRYHAYADENGLVGAVGFAAGNQLDRHSLKELKRLWHYYIARYGAYPLTFLITQEYNMYPDERAAKIPELIALGQFIKDTDPWKRAITAHAWVHTRDKGQAWNEPWLDYIMLQAGHKRTMSGKFYRELWPRVPVKPFLEAEANYEGFASEVLKVDAARIRDTAYVAMQCGSLGFTYGAQGLYAGVLDRAKPGPTAKWGPVKTWEEGLNLPGGAQMRHLRACYESVEWWKLQPMADAVEPAANVFVKGDADKAALLLYFPARVKVAPGARFVSLPAAARYEAEWFDPRTGERTKRKAVLTADEKGVVLPTRPDEQDWMLMLRKGRE
ncbi:MAG: DUF4038 domain-containing protein [Prosthecobacter sp.]